ncbi:Mov34/MPN/PAD-1 family protein [Motilimonas eburnea]|nr:Mov34/MPN/PAD-1 family protein [Motilimonas eburnea]
MAREIAINKMKAGEVAISSTVMMKEHIRSISQSYEREVFGVIHLNNQHQILDVEELFFGTIDSASVHPREVVKSCLARNSAAIVLYHNHPSGKTEPSQADRRITLRLNEALGLVDVRLLDHFVVSATGATSFAERGWI